MKRLNTALLLLLVPFLALFAGCSAGVGCAANVAEGIVVVVRDAVTGNAAAQGAVGTIRDGQYVETLHVDANIFPTPPDSTGVPVSLSGALGRPGTYTVHIEKQGYQPWEMAGIRVRMGDCTVETVHLQADLKPIQ